ncbi:phage portal protein [Enterococcus faecium]|uniref:phage portal protein n=1 Tax=Enterococcus faecium TaxID=1352 RepID=UPI002EC40765|nr:phage portal protein [Enterococcus faecium]
MRYYNPIDGEKKPKPFRVHPGTEVTQDLVNKFIQKHQINKRRYNYLMDMYDNRTDVFNLPDKEKYKPDNRLSIGYARYITDTFTGYFNGIPIHKQHEEETVNELIQLFDDDNDIEDEESELARLACIYGHSFEIMYQDEDSKTCVCYVDPTECFIVYDTTKEMKPVFAVHYVEDEEMKVFGTVYTETEEIDIEGNVGGVVFKDSAPNIFDGIPVIEFILNDSRTGIFESAVSLINAMNKATSEKANDVDYFADAYLAITGMEVSKEDAQKIRDNRIINAYGPDGAKIEIKFLDKPDSDATQEHLLDRLHKMIFQISMVADISDENFGATSGVALEHKYQAMNNLAHAFDRKFQSALRQRYKLLFSLTVNIPQHSADSYQQIEYTFKRNMPIDYLAQAQAATTTANLTSTETALKILDIVQDVPAELKRIEEERAENMKLIEENGGFYNDSEAKDEDYANVNQSEDTNDPESDE